MSVVGRAYVTVRAITNQLGRDIKSGVDDTLADIDSSGAADIGKGIGADIGSGIGEGLDDSNVSEKIDENVTKDRDKHRTASRDVGQDMGNALGDAIGAALIDRGPIERGLRAGMRAAIPEGESGGQKFGESVLGGIGKGVGAMALQPMVWIGALALPALQDAIGVAASLVGSLTSTVAAMGPGLAAGAAVGGLGITTLITTIGTLTAALKVESGELESFKESLTPVKNELHGVGEAIQRQLLPGLSDAAQRATSALGPTLRENLGDTGGVIAGITQKVADLAETPLFQAHLSNILESNNRALADFGDVGVSALDSVVTLGDAAGPIFERFSGWLGDVAGHVQDQIALADATGRLDRFMGRASDTGAQLGDILGSTFRGVWNVLKAASDSGKDLLDGLQENAQQFQDWTASVGGRNAIKDFFEDSVPVTREFGRLVGEVIDQFTTRGIDQGQLVQTLRMLREDLVPAVGAVLPVLTTVSRNLVGAVAPAVGTFAEDLLPSVIHVADRLGNALGPALDDLAPSLADLAGAAVDFIGALTPAIGPLGHTASIVADVLTPAVRGAATVLDALPDSIQGVIGAMIVLRIGLGALSRKEWFGTVSTKVKDELGVIRTSMLQTEGGVGKFSTGLKGAVNALGGPWMLAIGAAVTAVGFFAQSHAEAAADVEALTATLNDQTGAVTGNSREWAAKKLEDEGALEAAQRLGLNLEDVTSAALGQEDAARRVNAQIEEFKRQNPAVSTGLYGQSMNKTREDAESLDKALNGTNGTLAQARGEWNRTSAAVGDAGDKSQGAADGIRAAGNAARVSTGWFNDVGRSNKEFGDSAEDTKGHLDHQADAQRDLTRATLAYQKATAEAIGGDIGFQQALDDTAKELREGAHTLNIHTQAGRDNMQALLDLGSAADGVTGSARHQQQALETARRKIIEWADSAGMTRKEAIDLADRIIDLNKRYDNLPEKKDTRVDAETAEANRNLDVVTHKLNDIDGRRADAGINVDADAAEHRLDTFTDALNSLDGLTVAPVIGPIFSAVQNFANQANRRAGGGWLQGPGTGTSDSIPYGSGSASNLEFIVNARQAAANAKLVETINNASGPIDALGPRTSIKVDIHNPVEERGSESLQNNLVRLAQLGLLEAP